MSELLRDKIQAAFSREKRITEIRELMQCLDKQAKAENRGLTAKERRDWDLLVVELEINQVEKDNDQICRKTFRSLIPESFILKEVR